MNMNYIQNKFLKYQDISFWCEKFAIENDCKVSIRLVNHKTHEEITPNDVACMLYDAGVPSFRNAYNLRSFNKERAVFYLAVKGMSVAMICDFIYPVEIKGDYKEDKNGQLSFIF